MTIGHLSSINLVAPPVKANLPLVLLVDAFDWRFRSKLKTHITRLTVSCDRLLAALLHCT